MNWQLKRFHELNTDELYAILQARFTVFVIEQQCFYSEIDGKDQTACHLFAEHAGEIVAYVRIYHTAENQAAIGRVLVKKDYRGRGIAQELLERAITFIHKEMEEKTIRIQAQEYLKGFYRSLGFVPVSEVYLEDNIPHIDMIFTRP
jgi:ElaA protein